MAQNFSLRFFKPRIYFPKILYLKFFSQDFSRNFQPNIFSSEFLLSNFWPRIFHLLILGAALFTKNVVLIYFERKIFTLNENYFQPRIFLWGFRAQNFFFEFFLPKIFNPEFFLFTHFSPIFFSENEGPRILFVQNLNLMIKWNNFGPKIFSQEFLIANFFL